MEGNDVAQALLERHGIRIGNHMSRYVLSRLLRSSDDASALAIIGGDARTGLPLLVSLPIDQLRTEVAAVSASFPADNGPQR